MEAEILDLKHSEDRLRKNVRLNELKHQQAKQLLENSEERFRSVVETATDAIIVSDGQGNVSFWNHARNGYSDTGRRRCRQTHHADHADRFREMYHDHISQAVNSKKGDLGGKTLFMRG